MGGRKTRPYTRPQSMTKPTQKLRQLLNSGKTLIAPGAFDGLSARLIEQAGFDCIYGSGGAISRSAGFPDLGLLSFSEVVERYMQMVEVTHIPIVADADTGYGNEMNMRRTIEIYEKIGLAGCHIEDQSFPKRCGHLDDKSLIPANEMVLKIKAACKARKDKDFLIIARTDAIAVEGFDAAIKRANDYAAAGADMIFVEAPQTLEQIQMIAQQVKAPKLINMFYGGKTPLVPANDLQKMGYQLVIIPSDLQRAAIRAMQNTLQAIKKDGDSKSVNDQLASFTEREKIIARD